ncbi:MAG: sulfatase [Thermoplasmatales archaeon]|nr:MAG: sulfatase [Thermoplasmatales archaeon]
MIKELNIDKNIILITIDCLRADHLHCMGYKKNITPNIDKMAKNGILFTNAFSNAPYTPYSIPSFIVSRIPPIDKEIKETIGLVLKNNGYYTAAFNPNAIIFSDTFEGCNISNGFDVYDMMLNYRMRFSLIIGCIRQRMMKYLNSSFKSNTPIFKIIYNMYSKIIRKFPNILYPKEHLIIPNAESINTEAISWIKNQKGNFFLWLHYMDVHEPYAPRNYNNQNELLYLITKYRDFPNMITEKEREILINLYDLEILYVDNQINNLIEKLKEENCLKNSIIIITSDHGEEFGEHGAFGHGGSFKAHLYDECIHVPLIIYGLEKKGMVIERQVQLLDLSPTICEILNIPIPHIYLGKSLFNDSDGGIIVNSEFDIAYRTKNYKLIIRKTDGENNELYDLKNDPNEFINIYFNNKILKNLESDMIKLLNNYNKKIKLGITRSIKNIILNR